MSDLTERYAVLQRDLADLDAQHTGLLEKTRDLRAYKKATAARLAALAGTGEGGGCCRHSPPPTKQNDIQVVCCSVNMCGAAVFKSRRCQREGEQKRAFFLATSTPIYLPPLQPSMVFCARNRPISPGRIQRTTKRYVSYYLSRVPQRISQNRKHGGGVTPGGTSRLNLHCTFRRAARTYSQW